MTTRALNPLHVVALELASHGCVSGTLSEWPMLRSAFSSLGWEVPESYGSAEMRLLAREALSVVNPKGAL